MNRFTQSALCAAMLVCFTPFSFAADATPPQHAAEHAVHWGYNGKAGPKHWGELGEGNATCAAGKHQSPVDLKKAAAKHGTAKEFQIHYEAGAVALLNNGHTIQADVSDAADTVTFDNVTYKLAQFHFHTPSEHSINGKNFPMELHLVNKDDKGNITVVGVFIKQGKENKALSPIFSTLPKDLTPAGEHAGAPVQVDLATLLPANQKALVYSGSLTTPPCSENVNWVVMEQPIEMSKTQIAAFKKLFPDNHRPTQKINERKVNEEL